MNAAPLTEWARFFDILMATPLDDDLKQKLTISVPQETQDIVKELRTLQKAVQLDPSLENRHKLSLFLKELDTGSEIIQNLVRELEQASDSSREEISTLLVQTAELNADIDLTTLETLFKVATNSRNVVQNNCFRAIYRLADRAKNQSVLLAFFNQAKTIPALELIEEQNLSLYLNVVSDLLKRLVSSNNEFATIRPVLSRLYDCCDPKLPHNVKKEGIRAIMTSMLNEEFALYFFKEEHLGICERFVLDPDTKPLIISLLSCCFAKFSDSNQSKAQQVLRNIVRSKIDSDVIKGLATLNAIFLANPSYGVAIFMEEGFLGSILEALDLEPEVVQYHTVELLSSACSVSECRKAVSPHCSLIIPFYQQSKSLRLQLVGFLTLVKLLPDSKEASNELMRNQDLIRQLCDILQSNENQHITTALEGLVYLSVYPTIKEGLVRDEKMLSKLLGLLKEADRAMQYAICQTISNISTYAKQMTEEEQQVKKLHQMANSLPPNDPLDEDDAVTERIALLINTGLFPALAKIKTDSIHTVTAISQTLASIAINQKHRGHIIQCGFIPILVKYSNTLASQNILYPNHALAKLLITTNPALACKGELSKEVIRPLILLLVKSNHGLQQFEALMALTNMAGMDDDVRARILAFDCLVSIENLQFSSHNMIKRASTELLCNLIYHPLVFAKYLDPSSGPGLQVMTALSDDEDFPTRRAASGALAVLSSDPESIPLLVQQTRFFEIVLNLLQDQQVELVHRGAELIKNIFVDDKIGKSVPANIVEAMKKLVKFPHPAISTCAKEGLLRAMKLGLKIT
jgi:hypothetical protein